MKCARTGLLLVPLLLILSFLHSNAQTGPMVGTVTTTDAFFLYRPGSMLKTLKLTVLGERNQTVASNESTTTAENDYVAKFHITGLTAATSYTYKIDDITSGSPVPIIGPADGLRFKTPLPLGKKGVVTAGFISCVNNTAEPIWQRLEALGIDQLFLCGDTPYVDTTNLADIRTKHRSFLSTQFMSELIRHTPTAGTWDDHDFGLNGANGVTIESATPGRKANARRVFTEYRAHDQFGTGPTPVGSEGIYHKIDNGVMEVFMLDPRWFSQTEPSPVDPSKKTCFGAAQWQWLKDSLLNSKAPFKVLVQGQIWQDKKNGETDDMFTYMHERDALFDFIKENKIPGVVIFGGDIHVSRHLIHHDRVGYDLHDFIMSPGHNSVIAGLDVPHPDLDWSSRDPHQFLTITADTRPAIPVMTARYMKADGTVEREVVIPYNELTPESGTDLGKDLRAWWSFDGNFNNQSALGALQRTTAPPGPTTSGSLNATPVNGAKLIADGALHGGAASFSRTNQQYLLISRNPLDDNSAAHSVSMWCKPTSLPAHGSTDRYFLMESIEGAAVSNNAAYSISMSLEANAQDSSKIDVRLFPLTLQPAASVSTSPTPLSQASINGTINRSLLDNWTNFVVTFDSNQFKIFVNGTEVGGQTLATPGPALSFGGLVIGGHRAGTGRNFDGMIDEVALWGRVLSPSEITTLYNNGNPLDFPVQASTVDSDEDTLADWWEVLNGLDPANPDDAMADTDSDKVPAWLEKQLGFHPQVDNSVALQYIKQSVLNNTNQIKLTYRHPGTNLIKFKLKIQQSENLMEWKPADLGLAQKDAQTGVVKSEIPTSPSGKGFYKSTTEL